MQVNYFGTMPKLFCGCSRCCCLGSGFIQTSTISNSNIHVLQLTVHQFCLFLNHPGETNNNPFQIKMINHMLKVCAGCRGGYPKYPMVLCLILLMIFASRMKKLSLKLIHLARNLSINSQRLTITLQWHVDILMKHPSFHTTNNHKTTA
jgi:hypothetical protein